MRSLLTNHHCQPDTALLEEADIHQGWNRVDTLAFVNALAWIAHAEDHHPELTVGYNRCVVNYRTHSVGDLSENDFICAARIDLLVAGDVCAL